MNVYRKIDREKIQFDFICMGDKEGHYDNEIRKLGGKIYRISPPAKIGYIKHINEIREIIRNNGPYKAVHSPTQFHSGIVCLAAFLEKVPIRIAHSHSAGIKDKKFIRRIYNFFCRGLIILFSTDKIACGEKAAELLFGRTKRIKQKVIILKNGINIDNYMKVTQSQILKEREKLKIKEDENIIGHIGRFSKEKNHKFFIKLALHYKKNNKKVKIVLVGDGELKENIETMVEKHNLNDYFIFTGIREDVPILMNLFDVFVMPSLYEGFPVSIIEALASGKKCVVSDTISKEVEIIDNSVKFLSLNDTMEKWSEEIQKQIETMQKERNIKEILVRKGFSIEDTVKVLTKLYLKEGKNEEKTNIS